MEGGIAMKEFLPDVHFGSVDNPLPDWRKMERLKEDGLDNDELLKDTPQDVIDTLGFDPLEFEFGEFKNIKKE